MFPSENRFRDIPCPFFSRATCLRPYCHFKHTTAISNSLSIPPDANETLNKIISQLSSASTTNATTSTAASNPTVDLTSILESTLLKSLTTALTTALNAVPQTIVAAGNPENVNAKLTQAISQITTKLNSQSSPTTSQKKSEIPEYRPTPIAELERRKRDQTKKIENSLDRMSTSEPYTPADFSSSPTAERWVSPVSRQTSKDVEQKKISKDSTIKKVKTRVAEIDFDRVPVTSTIRLDPDSDGETKTKAPIKRRSSSERQTNVVKKLKSTPALSKNSTKNVKIDEKDKELELFDLAFQRPTTTTQTSTRSNEVTFLNNNVTRAETSNDGQRIAHKPKFAAQPTSNGTAQPLMDSGSISQKIPLKTRQEYLKLLMTEMQKVPNSNEPVVARAQKMEKDIFDKSNNKNTYLNLAARSVRQIRADQPTKNDGSSPKKILSNQRLMVSHSAMLGGTSSQNDEFSKKKSKEIDLKMLSENEIYTLMIVYRATESDLVENGYPSFSQDHPGKVLIENKNSIYKTSVKLPSLNPSMRLCCRCGKTYRVNEHGAYITKEECIYHWGRIRPQRVARQIEKRYSCCHANFDGIGCSVAKCHVHEGDDQRLLDGFVKTSEVKGNSTMDEFHGIYAIDCEMCYTINGLELVRVSLINHKLETVIDTLVRPDNEILDYNTRWSGIQEKDLENCHVHLRDVQQRLLKLINERTILIGHSLESDLKALKIVHQTIIDTSLVFPHAKGKPFKRALKNLASEHLNKFIQESSDGHNSIEDATVCMELMLWKIREDLKGTTPAR